MANATPRATAHSAGQGATHTPAQAAAHLRDRTAITQMLIVAELARRPATLSDIAQGLGITVQAVSAHAKRLVQAGWLETQPAKTTLPAASPHASPHASAHASPHAPPLTSPPIGLSVTGSATSSARPASPAALATNLVTGTAARNAKVAQGPGQASGNAAAGLRVTPKGLQQLHEGTRRLREAVGQVAGDLDVIQMASALAAAPIAAGQEVGLWMEEGDLVARPLAAPNAVLNAATNTWPTTGQAAPSPTSRGRAVRAAAAGAEVVVGDLHGMVQLDPGRLTVLSLPAPAEGGVARVEWGALTEWLASRPAPQRVGAHGTGARILARTLAAQRRLRLDFEFAADRAAFNAAERGLDVLLLVTRDRLSEVTAAFEHLNARTIRRVPVALEEAPEATPEWASRGAAARSGGASRRTRTSRGSA